MFVLHGNTGAKSWQKTNGMSFRILTGNETGALEGKVYQRN